MITSVEPVGGALTRQIPFFGLDLDFGIFRGFYQGAKGFLACRHGFIQISMKFGPHDFVEFAST